MTCCLTTDTNVPAQHGNCVFSKMSKFFCQSTLLTLIQTAKYSSEITWDLFCCYSVFISSLISPCSDQCENKIRKLDPAAYTQKKHSLWGSLKVIDFSLNKFSEHKWETWELLKIFCCIISLLNVMTNSIFMWNQQHDQQ